jgi:uncharacterized membrane protein YgcG
MKKFVVTFFVLSLLLLIPSKIRAAEIITHFQSDITINQDTSLSISEQINYTTDQNKHGIYRYLPLSYNQDGQKTITPIEAVTITNQSGKTIPYTTDSDGTFLTLKIGDPDATFSGDQTYIINYTVKNALSEFDNHDELYWDITGEGWQVQIASTTATINSPSAQITQVDCFSGETGSNNQGCETTFTDQTAQFTYDTSIEYGDNMTVVVGLNKDNQLIFPTQQEKYLQWLQLNWTLFLIPLPLLGIFFWWYKKGRDIQFLSANVYDLDPNRPTSLKPFTLFSRPPFVYAPIKELSAGEAGALLDEKVDSQDVIAEILELARKKYLKIESSSKKKLFGTQQDYQFNQLDQGTLPLTATQKYLLNEIFKDKKQIKVSELKGKFYLVMAQAKQKLEKSLVDKKIYTNSPTKVRGVGMGVFFSSGAIVFAFIANQLFPWGIYWPLIPLLLQIPFGLLLAYNLPQKTAVGTNLWLQTTGLQKSIRYGKWREKIKEKNLFIEEVLPFAISLGVVDQLTKDMEKLNIAPPEYFKTNNITAFSTAHFINTFTSEVNNNLSYNPSASSSSGGSGLSGGFSGGGGGGGGGGSW